MKTAVRFAILFFTMSSTAHVFAATDDRLKIGINCLAQRNSLTQAQQAAMRLDPFLNKVLKVCNANRGQFLMTEEDKEKAIMNILAAMELDIATRHPKTPPLPPPARRRLDLGTDDTSEEKASAKRLEGAKNKLLKAFPG